MGTFLGHILPGTFFFIYGMLYVVRDAFNLSLNSKKKSRPPPSPSRQPSPDGPERKPDDARSADSDGDPSKGKLEKGESTSNGWESFDFESDADDRETCLFSRKADDVFSPNPERTLESHDKDLHSDSLERRDDVGEEQPKVTRKCAPIKECLTNISIIEGVLKIVCAIIGALGELWWGGWYIVSPRTGNFTNMNNWQHATMFTYFAVSGVADIVFQTCLKSDRSSSDRPREKIFLSLAFSVEGLLFYFHTHGREEIDVLIHTLLVIAIVVCAVASGLEPWCYSPATPGFRRLWVIATCVQGTWFWQIAFVLYNPWRDRDDRTHEVEDDEVMRNIMMMTTMFTWHVLAVLSITGLVHVVIRYFSRFRCCKN